jgi:hypothetical protein
MTLGKRVLGAVALALAALAGCSDGESSSGSGSSTVPASEAQIVAICEAQCDRRQRCFPEDAESTCVESCAAESSVFTNGLRADLAVALADCQRDWPCGMNDDECTVVAFETVGEDPDRVLQSPDIQQCLAKEQECRGTEGDFSDDLCGVLAFLVPSKRSEMARCFERGCGEVTACLAPLAE